MSCARRFLVMTFLLSWFWAGAAGAATIFLKARLDGAQAGALTSADGAGIFSYDTTSGLLAWSVSFRNLSSTFVAAHLHGPAAAGASAPILVPLPGSTSPLAGSATITPAQAADMLNGLWYANVHTANYPEGEIRGQLSVIDTASYTVTSGVSAASTAFINGAVRFDPATLQMSYLVSWGVPPLHTVTGAGFHGPASGNEDAPLTLSTLASPGGSVTLTAAQAAELVNGFWYFQVDDADGPLRAYVLPRYPELANISTRTPVGTGDNVAIAGFIIGGTSRKTVAVVAQGPSLLAAGVPNALANPKITVVRSSDQAVIATNDDWKTDPDSLTRDGGFAPPDDREAAKLLDLDPGAYTVIVSGADGGTGIGLVAVYEVNHPEVPLVNISTRGRIGTGNDVVIGGFIIQGDGPRTVVVTGTGPSLANAGVLNRPLADPFLILVRSSDLAVIATNDNWRDAPNAAAIQAAGFAPTEALESAIMMTLPPGAYTVILGGAGGTTGIGVVGVYSVP